MTSCEKNNINIMYVSCQRKKKGSLLKNEKKRVKERKDENKQTKINDFNFQLSVDEKPESKQLL